MILSIILIEELALETSQYVRQPLFRLAAAPPREQISTALPKPGARQPAIKIWLAELAASSPQRAGARIWQLRRPRPVCASNSAAGRQMGAPVTGRRRYASHHAPNRQLRRASQQCALPAGARAASSTCLAHGSAPLAPPAVTSAPPERRSPAEL